MMFKLLAVLVVLLAVAVVRPRGSALAAALVYALAYTVELGLSLLGVLRPGADAREARCSLAPALLALALPAPALRARRVRPDDEFEQHEWVPIHLGPLDLSINKAVVYLMLGAGAHDPARHRASCARRSANARAAGRRSARSIYEVAQVQVAEQGLPTKAIGRWFPYVATLMLFIWVVNMLGFIPLPLTGET